MPWDRARELVIGTRNKHGQRRQREQELADEKRAIRMSAPPHVGVEEQDHRTRSRSRMTGRGWKG